MNGDTLQSALVITLNVASMLAMGLELTLGRLGASLRATRPMAIGLAVNLLAAPLLVWAMATAAALPVAAALAFLLCAAAPGGNTGPLLTANARGDTAYAVALVVVLSFASVATVPLVLGAFLRGQPGAVEVPTAVMVQLILMFQIAPLCVGMAVHAAWPPAARRLAPMVRVLGNASLAVLTLLLLVTKGRLLLSNGVVLLVLIEAFVLLALFSGRLLGPVGDGRARALAMTTCTRNLSLALLLGAQVFRDPATMMAILAYGLLWVTTAVAAGLWLRRQPLAGA